MTKISNEIKKVEKKLTTLYSEKAKEENRTSKTTAKYNEEMQNLKNAYTSKMETYKKENQAKMTVINDDIAFYEKHKDGILKLEAQIASLDRKVDERMGKTADNTEDKGYDE